MMPMSKKTRREIYFEAETVRQIKSIKCLDGGQDAQRVG